MHRLAIIPARSGSKRIRNKNIKKFLGKPVINYSIDLAIKSNFFHTIHVSTDSKKYKNLVQNKNIDMSFLRPKNLSKDDTPLFDVVKYVVNKFDNIGLNFSEIFLISSCNPLIKLSDLKYGYKLFKKYKKKHPVMPVIKYSVPIEWALTLQNESIKEFKYSSVNRKSQSFKNYYFDSSSFYIFPRNILKYSSVKDYISKYKGFEISRFHSIDIDNIEDWKLAEAIYRFKHKK